MNKVFIIIDMQNDFITGSLANQEALKIVPKIVEKMKSLKEERIVLTYDTHEENYLNTFEGKKLPVEHCIRDTWGWEIESSIYEVASKKGFLGVWKPNFGGGQKIYNQMQELNNFKDPEEIYMCGTCTDICVVSNALQLRTLYPNARIVIYKDLCAGLTPEKHEAALEVMRSCQIEVI